MSQLIAPFAPFFGEWLYRGLTLQHGTSGQSNSNAISVHLTDLPVCNEGWIDLAMERRMELAQNISSLVLSLRKGQKIRVSQPLKQILIPIIAEQMKLDIIKIEELIKAEVNIKEINFITNQDNIIVRKAKPNFRNLGKKLGKNMQAAITIIQDLEASQLDVLQTGHSIQIVVDREIAALIWRALRHTGHQRAMRCGAVRIGIGPEHAFVSVSIEAGAFTVR